MAIIRIKIEFAQEDHDGKPVCLRAIVEKDMSESEIENLDDCEKSLLEICYAGMREGMKEQMSYVSKKKALRHQMKKTKKDNLKNG